MCQQNADRADPTYSHGTCPRRPRASEGLGTGYEASWAVHPASQGCALPPRERLNEEGTHLHAGDELVAFQIAQHGALVARQIVDVPAVL